MTHTELAWFLGVLVSIFGCGIVSQLDRLSTRIDRLREDLRDPHRAEDRELSEWAEDD